MNMLKQKGLFTRVIAILIIQLMIVSSCPMTAHALHPNSGLQEISKDRRLDQDPREFQAEALLIAANGLAQRGRHTEAQELINQAQTLMPGVNLNLSLPGLMQASGIPSHFVLENAVRAAEDKFRLGSVGQEGDKPISITIRPSDPWSVVEGDKEKIVNQIVKAFKSAQAEEKKPLSIEVAIERLLSINLDESQHLPLEARVKFIHHYEDADENSSEISFKRSDTQEASVTLLADKAQATLVAAMINHLQKVVSSFLYFNLITRLLQDQDIDRTGLEASSEAYSRIVKLNNTHHEKRYKSSETMSDFGTKLRGHLEDIKSHQKNIRSIMDQSETPEQAKELYEKILPAFEQTEKYLEQIRFSALDRPLTDETQAAHLLHEVRTLTGILQQSVGFFRKDWITPFKLTGGTLNQDPPESYTVSIRPHALRLALYLILTFDFEYQSSPDERKKHQDLDVLEDLTISAEVDQESKKITLAFKNNYYRFSDSELSSILNWENMESSPLSVSRHLLGQANAQITIENNPEPEEGSTVTAVIPYQEKADSGMKSEGDQKLLVLVVEDNGMNRELLKETLGEIYDLVFAVDGEQALKKIGELKNDGRNIDAALFDKEMPGMDGIQLAKAVYEARQEADDQDQTFDFPIIFISGDPKDGEIATLINKRKAKYTLEKNSSTEAFKRAIDAARVQNDFAPEEHKILLIGNSEETEEYKERLENEMNYQTVALSITDQDEILTQITDESPDLIMIDMEQRDIGSLIVKIPDVTKVPIVLSSHQYLDSSHLVKRGRIKYDLFSSEEIKPHIQYEIFLITDYDELKQALEMIILSSREGDGVKKQEPELFPSIQSTGSGTQALELREAVIQIPHVIPVLVSEQAFSSTHFALSLSEKLTRIKETILTEGGEAGVKFIVPLGNDDNLDKAILQTNAWIASQGGQGTLSASDFEAVRPSDAAFRANTLSAPQLVSYIEKTMGVRPVMVIGPLDFVAQFPDSLVPGIKRVVTDRALEKNQVEQFVPVDKWDEILRDAA